MIRKTLNKTTSKTSSKVIFNGLGAVTLGVVLAGCGGNTTDTSPSTPPAMTTPETAPATPPTTQTTDGGAAAKGDNHDAEIEATMAKFFPNATLTKKPFPLNADAAQHFSDDTGVKFSGDESKWQVYEATKDGQRVGLGMMTHSALPDGKDMHIAFAVNPKFAVTHVVALDAPNNAQMETFAKQLIGKDASAPLKVGKELKAPAGLSPQVAQIAADAVKKGLAILASNFNANSTHSH